MSWLTRFLGFDFQIDRLQSQVQDYRDLVRVKDEHFSSMLAIKDEQLAIKDEEIKRLTDLMLVEHGVIRPDASPVDPTKAKPQPIGRRSSFRSVRDKFEAADRKMAQQIATSQVEVLTDYWTKKDKEAAKEGVA